MSSQTFSEAERQARSIRAKQAHKEGRLGEQSKPSRHNSKPRLRNASDLAKTLFAENEDEIRRQVTKGLKQGSVAQKTKLIELLLKTALSSERLDTSEHRTELEHHSHEELLKLLTDKLTNGPGAAIIRAQLAQSGVIEGTATELPE